jgi:two-component system OmpR family response regulator
VTRDGKPVLLQPREYRLLEELMRGEGRIVTRTMLLENVWDFHFDPQTNIVETHMSRLRAKLNEGGRIDLIETVRGSGYRMRGQ